MKLTLLLSFIFASTLGASDRIGDIGNFGENLCFSKATSAAITADLKNDLLKHVAPGIEKMFEGAECDAINNVESSRFHLELYLTRIMSESLKFSCFVEGKKALNVEAKYKLNVDCEGGFNFELSKLTIESIIK